MLGSILGAVSPAVVVPLMIRFIEEKRGAKKGIPTLVLAGSSCDDAVAIVVFTNVLSIYLGSGISLTSQIASIPYQSSQVLLQAEVSVLSLLFVWHLIPSLLNESCYLLLRHFDGKFPGNFGVCSFCRFNINYDNWLRYPRKERTLAHEISHKLGQVWIFAQILLFVYVGMQVNVPAQWMQVMGAVVVAAVS